VYLPHILNNICDGKIIVISFHLQTQGPFFQTSKVYYYLRKNQRGHLFLVFVNTHADDFLKDVVDSSLQGERA
jgi:hypothetical protein